MNKRFLVLGLGALGKSLATTLARDGAEVIALDTDKAQVDEIKDEVDVAVVGDATDRNTLEQIGASSVDVAVVSIGEDLEASILAAVNLLELKVKHVAARANTKTAETIMRRLGVHEVFWVEPTVGAVMARRLYQPFHVIESDFAEDLRIVQCKPVPSWVGKSFDELALPRHYRVQVIGVRKSCASGCLIEMPTARTIVGEDNLLILAGHPKDVSGVLLLVKRR